MPPVAASTARVIRKITGSMSVRRPSPAHTPAIILCRRSRRNRSGASAEECSWSCGCASAGVVAPAAVSAPVSVPVSAPVSVPAAPVLSVAAGAASVGPVPGAGRGPGPGPGPVAACS
ncbi:hypothetical protein GCM10010339_67750 [Streptomyces alanosinicus]|uniref:Uncharacterized protein n=1 Tax=Streptomyces alanosinicus TaxID=68171 RepID=A0A918YR58_9ACTN|nr:hypothetical protein GCM10010339_67750 [Streptomyces alanosinicus]